MKTMGTLKVRVIWEDDGGRMVVVRPLISWMPHRPERMQVRTKCSASMFWPDRWCNSNLGINVDAMPMVGCKCVLGELTV